MKLPGLIVLVAFAGCASGPPARVPEPVSSAELDTVGSARIFFGHQSVGRDLITGLADVAPELRVSSRDPLRAADGGMLTDAALGRNGDPTSKDRAFLEVVAGLDPGDLAFYKYCFLDMGPETDPDSLFAAYARTLDRASASGVRVLAVTMPLTTIEPAWKRGIKTLLGRPTDLALDRKRLQFNELVRARYPETARFDLARAESTLEDGSRSLHGAVEVLDGPYTDDGAHLNSRGRQHVAALFVRALARALAADS